MFKRKHSEKIREKIQYLHESGYNNYEIERITGINNRTVANIVGVQIRDPFPERFTIRWNGKNVTLSGKY